MNANNVAIPFIDCNLVRYGLSWKNHGRTSEDWKVKLYEQATTGLQLAIYDRETTIVRVERSLIPLPGIVSRSHCPKSHALDSSYSNFKDGKGTCLVVEDLVALECLLDHYFAPTATPETLDDVIDTFELELKDARARTSAERDARLAKASKKAREISVRTRVFLRNPDALCPNCHRRKHFGLAPSAL